MRVQYAFSFPMKHVGTVIVVPIQVVVVTAGNGERLAAVHRDGRGDRPTIQNVAHNRIEAFKVIWLPHRGDDNLIAHVIVLALAFQTQVVVVLRFRGGIMANVAGRLQRGASQTFAPDVEAV